MKEIKNQERLNDSEIAHLQMNGAFSTKGFQALLDWQKRDNLFCADCKVIAEKIGMKPRGGWVREVAGCSWHKHHDDLRFDGGER